jgi:hypothetical protein
MVRELSYKLSIMRGRKVTLTETVMTAVDAANRMGIGEEEVRVG